MITLVAADTLLVREVMCSTKFGIMLTLSHIVEKRSSCTFNVHGNASKCTETKWWERPSESSWPSEWFQARQIALTPSLGHVQQSPIDYNNNLASNDSNWYAFENDASLFFSVENQNVLLSDVGASLTNLTVSPDLCQYQTASCRLLQTIPTVCIQ